MTEIYANVRDRLKDDLEAAWSLVLQQKDPISAVDFLNKATEYLTTTCISEEEVDFIRFYFNLKMAEMIRE